MEPFGNESSGEGPIAYLSPEYLYFFRKFIDAAKSRRVRA
jgi:hypothetical protein